MAYNIKWGPQYLICEYFGDVTTEDILTSNQRIYGDTRFDALRWELVVFDRTESISFTASSIKAVASMDRAAAMTNPRITVIFVGENETLNHVGSIYAGTESGPDWPMLQVETLEQAFEIMGSESSEPDPKPPPHPASRSYNA